MEFTDNPFAELLSNKDSCSASKHISAFDRQSVDVTKILESILLVSHDRSLSFGTDGRPSCLLFVPPAIEKQIYLSIDNLDQIIFDRAQMSHIIEADLIHVSSAPIMHSAESVITGSVNYLVSCFTRANQLKSRTDLTSVVEKCRDALVRQLLLFLLIDAELGVSECGQTFYKCLYDAISGDDPECVACMEDLFTQTIRLFERDSSEVDGSASKPYSSVKLEAIRPLVVCLADGLRRVGSNSSSATLHTTLPLTRRERLLFCPQRKPLAQLALWFSRFPSTSQLLLEASFPSNYQTRQVEGFEVEGGILGRLLVPSHLQRDQSPERTLFSSRQQNSALGEFFTDDVPLKPMVEAEQRTIWQLTEQLDVQLYNLMLNFLRVGKQHRFIKDLFFHWIGLCITANKGRGQLAHTSGLMFGTESKELASDGFLNNLTAVLVRLTGPLLHPPPEGPPLNKIWPNYASNPTQTILPLLYKETRLSGCSPTISNINPVDYPLLTELFFLTHAAIRIGWTSLITEHFETAQQLHQLGSQWESFQMATDTDPRSQFIRQIMRVRTSRYLEQSTSLSCPTRLRDQLAFAVTTSRLLVFLARTTSTDVTDASRSLPSHGHLAELPEFIVDNVVELVGYLRQANDDFIESTDVMNIPLEPLLEFSILFMQHTRSLVNPHLRARMAEVLESLIPERDSETWNSQRAVGTGVFAMPHLSFLRRKQLMDAQPDSLKCAVVALLTAFVSIELSPGTAAVGSAGSAAEVLLASASASQSDGASTQPNGTERGRGSGEAMDTQTATVGFEEKFRYRRPMYACLKYWHGNPLYDAQFQQLETDALVHIDDTSPPLFLQFLSLLINDAIFLLDEAIGLLTQLKQKEREREELGGRLPTEENEALFHHTGRLARHHILLGLDTLTALRRIVSICPRLVTHPMLVDRVACMLNYFLTHLVGPKQRDLNVRDRSAYGFRPDLLVMEICQIYCCLAVDKKNPDQTSSFSAQAFRRAVVLDERSFKPELLDRACGILARVGAATELRESFSAAAALIKSENVIKMEDDLDLEGAPDDFIDPIMGDLMVDPVKLPTSGHVVDRKTIYRHLLNDSTDPFNRQPLAMSQVQPQDDLKAAICAWVAERRAQRQASNA